MYFGSVKFFKHLILAFISFLIIALVVFTVSLALTVKAAEQLTPVENAKDDECPSNPATSVMLDKAISSSMIESDNIDYQLYYPQLYAISQVKKLSDEEKKTYLTFDDGPSKQTPKILDILDKYGIKATFFVVYKNDEFSNSMYKEIVNRGHTIGVHSASHEYSIIYDSVDNFLKDFNKIYLHIYELTGVKANLFRFPGGSINSHNYSIYQPLIAEMLRRGFTFHDWNVEAGDASTKATEKTIYNTVVNNVMKKDKSVVLMHDSLSANFTVQALPNIIEEIKKAGYSFDKLDTTVAPFLFSYKN